MATWIFEPGHTAAGLRVRHMMLSWVDILSPSTAAWSLTLDVPATLPLQATIQAKELWTGESARDDHLRSADFLDTTIPRSLFEAPALRL